MSRYTRTGVVLALAIAVGGCENFLSGPGLTSDPNNPIEATAQQQLISVAANLSARLEGQIARNATIYTQQIIGTNNQQLTYATQYSITEGDIGQNFTGFYTGGGLVALRNIQEFGAANDRFLEGVAKIWEGLAFGMATSVWGDLPYTEANDPAFLTPRLDAQQDIYTAVQTRLDEGIAALQAAPTAGNCEPSDVIYCSGTPLPSKQVQINRWIAAARTMKARFFMHLVERNGNAAATLALAQAQQGINEAPADVAQAIHGQAPGDFRTFHGGTLDVDGNIWAEFLTARGGDIGAGHVLVQLLKDRNDPRLGQYFTANNASGEFWGLNQNNGIVGAPTGAVPSVINLPVRRALTFRQPILTWAENQLIMAEAKFRLGDATAITHVNNVRASIGMTPVVAVTLTDIMLEKYIALFQNIEVWNDYKRTCVPTLARYQTATEVPGRLPYGSAERTNNPNIPLPSAYPTGTTGPSRLRNWNDPAQCP
jgi:starch-binding outer membrane protein, SusD/RagB family